MRSILSFLAPLVIVGAASAYPTLDSGSMTGARPTSGSVTYHITGTVHISEYDADGGGFTEYHRVVEQFSSLGESEMSLDLFGGPSFFPVDNAAYKAFVKAGKPGTYSGPIYDIVVTSTTPVGLYNQNTFSSIPYVYGGYDDFDRVTGAYYWSDYSRYWIQFEVTAPQAVPEPATMAALGFGALVMVRRRKRG